MQYIKIDDVLDRWLTQVSSDVSEMLDPTTRKNSIWHETRQQEPRRKEKEYTDAPDDGNLHVNVRKRKVTLNFND